MHPDDAAPVSPRLVSRLEGMVLEGISQLEADAQRVTHAMRGMADVDQHALERGLIALQRATEQLKNAVTRNEVVQ